MKNKILYILYLLLLSSNLFAQDIEQKGNKYYTSEGELYTGIYKEYFENGNLKLEASIKEGVYDGITILYFKSGNRKEQRAYREGKMDGTWINWNPNEVKIGLANYKDGKKHGEW